MTDPDKPAIGGTCPIDGTTIEETSYVGHDSHEAIIQLHPCGCSVDIRDVNYPSDHD